METTHQQMKENSEGVVNVDIGDSAEDGANGLGVAESILSIDVRHHHVMEVEALAATPNPTATTATQSSSTTTTNNNAKTNDGSTTTTTTTSIRAEEECEDENIEIISPNAPPTPITTTSAAAVAFDAVPTPTRSRGGRGAAASAAPTAAAKELASASTEVDIAKLMRELECDRALAEQIYSELHPGYRTRSHNRGSGSRRSKLAEETNNNNNNHAFDTPKTKRRTRKQSTTTTTTTGNNASIDIGGGGGGTNSMSPSSTSTTTATTAATPTASPPPPPPSYFPISSTSVTAAAATGFVSISPPKQKSKGNRGRGAKPESPAGGAVTPASPATPNSTTSSASSSPLPYMMGVIPPSAHGGSARAKSRYNKRLRKAGVDTCIPVNKMPDIMDRLKKELNTNSSSNNNDNDNDHTFKVVYDIYRIQTFLIETVMEMEFAEDIPESDRIEQLFRHVLQRVQEDESFKATEKQWKDPTPCPSLDQEADDKVIEGYHSYMESDEMKLKRAYRYDSPIHREWTEEEWKLFEEAYKLFPDGPWSNKRISEYMCRKRGCRDFHANHVSYYKAIYKKRQKAHKRAIANGSAAPDSPPPSELTVSDESGVEAVNSAVAPTSSNHFCK